MTFMVGQRVIYQKIICVICKPEVINSGFPIWISNPERGYKHGVAFSSIQPLPNGQL